jgi:hypothetical protein
MYGSRLVGAHVGQEVLWKGFVRGSGGVAGLEGLAMWMVDGPGREASLSLVTT